ncbi:MAG: bifunctional diaminohydroxyphosphoribosylaminopyrimidine deaminase/5-amino-6-(5-phosphoribosylamino)uracil reductase RibD [Steroidobacteraceae bacterium]
MFTEFDHRMMARALRLAERGLYTTDPNPRVGCVITAHERIVGEGWTHPVGGPHAEVNALRAAGALSRGATAYVSLEPCSHHGRTPPCSDALIAAGVRRVVCAVGDPNPLVDGAGISQLRAAGIEVESGLLAQQAERLNIGFFKRMLRGLPYVTVKVAASLDGKVALGNGASRWITGAPARRDVQRLRARSSAVLTGIGTVLADDPQLNVRDAGIDMLGRQPVRVICDSKLRMPVGARMLREPGATLVYTTATQVKALEEAGATVQTVGADSRGSVDLAAVLRDLASRHCNEVLVEAGPVLSGRFLELGLADALITYVAPMLLGSEAQSMLALPAIDDMQQRLELDLVEQRQLGNDIKFTWKPRRRNQG